MRRASDNLSPPLAERVARVAEDSRHGASWLAREALEAVAEAVELGEDHVEVARAMVNARPAIGAIAGALGRVLAAGRTPEQVAEEAHALVAARDRASHAIAVLLAPRMNDVVMTHSASATVQEVIVHTPPRRVVCTVSEPIGEGRRFVEELRGAGIAADLVEDSDAPDVVRTVELLLLGADAVFPDGSLVNKIGTAALAGAAKDAGVPVLVACEVIKLVPAEGYEPAEEERFELTAAESIDAFVTEEGVFAPGDIAALIDRTPFLREGYGLVARESG